MGGGLLARLTVAEQGRQLGFYGLGRNGFGSDQMHKPGVDAHDFVVNGLQARKELLDAKVAQGTDAVGFALKSRQVQSHGSNSLLMEGEWQLASCRLRLAHPAWANFRQLNQLWRARASA